MLKPARDRDALRDAVFRGETEALLRQRLGAPSALRQGRAPAPASGIYSSPCAVAALAGLFDEARALGSLESFLSVRGAAFYGLPPPAGRLILERRGWTVPEEEDGAVPMLAGRSLAWSAYREE